MKQSEAVEYPARDQVLSQVNDLRGEPAVVVANDVDEASGQVVKKRSVWAVPAYRAWFASDTATNFSGAIYSFALSLMVLVATGDPAKAGVLGAVSQGLEIVLTFLAGSMADRSSRVRLMTIGASLGTAISIVVLAAAITNNLTYTVLFGISLAFSVRYGLFETATEATLKDVVPSDMMGSAQAANQGRSAAIQLISGPVAGFLLGIGSWLIACTMLISNVVAGITAWVVGRLAPNARDPRPNASSEEDTSKKRSLVADGIEGMRWLANRKDLLTTALIGTFVNLGLNASMDTLIYSLQQEGMPMVQIGVLTSVVGGVLLVGSLFAGKLITRMSVGLVMILGFVLMTAGQIAIIWNSTLVGIAICLSVGLMLIPSLNAGLGGYSMVATPAEYVGRVTSARTLLVLGAMPFAPILAGFGLAHFGRTWTLLVCAGITLIGLALAVGSKAVRNIPKQSEWEQYAIRFKA